ncbi:MAG: cysteine hydrolase [Maribacter sp.]|nr:cysteine hydrolase [Maribacter sp.]
MKDKGALLIIDMQKGSFTPRTPRYDTKGVVERINALAGIFRASDCPVIFIQHDGTELDEFIPNTIEWELLDELEVEPEDIVITKYANDAFYSSSLSSKLKELQIEELFVSGCATDFCVESTIQSALSKNFDITVVADAHTTGDRPNLTAKQVIDHYNWVWQNMIPTKGKIKVLDYEKVKQLLK